MNGIHRLRVEDEEALQLFAKNAAFTRRFSGIAPVLSENTETNFRHSPAESRKGSKTSETEEEQLRLFVQKNQARRRSTLVPTMAMGI